MCDISTDTWSVPSKPRGNQTTGGSGGSNPFTNSDRPENEGGDEEEAEEEERKDRTARGREGRREEAAEKEREE